jgi:prepilin-type N-terminal cleavage/methylation domain-containing protein
MLTNCPESKKKGFKSGFTLIELLVVLGIMGIVVSLGVASFNNFQDRKKVEVAADNLASGMRQAQSKAVNGQKDCADCGGSKGNCSGTNQLDGWFVDVYESAGAYYYDIYGSCGGIQFGAQTTSLAPGISVAPETTIGFKPLGGTDITTASTALTVSDSKSATEDYIVTIYKTGDVEVTESP